MLIGEIAKTVNSSFYCPELGSSSSSLIAHICLDLLYVNIEIIVGTNIINTKNDIHIIAEMYDRYVSNNEQNIEIK